MSFLRRRRRHVHLNDTSTSGHYLNVPPELTPSHRCEDQMRDVRETEAEVGTTWECDGRLPDGSHCGREWIYSPGLRWMPADGLP